MNQAQLLQNIKDDFLVNATTNFAIHGFSSVVLYSGGTIPTKLLITDLLQAGLRSTVAIPTQNIIEWGLVNYYGRNGNEVKFSRRIIIRAESVAISVIISKFIVPSRRNAFTLIVQPFLLSSLSVIIMIIKNLQKTGEMLEENFPEFYTTLLQIINEGGYNRVYLDFMNLTNRIRE